MKKNHVLLSLFLFLVVVQITNADLTTARLVNYNFTSNLKEEWSGYELTGVNSPTFASGGVVLDGSTQYAYYTTDKNFITDGTDFTFCTKFQTDTSSGLSRYIWDERGTNSGFQVRLDDSTGMKMSYVFDGVSAGAYRATTALSTNTNYTSCVVYHGGTDNGEILLNNVNETGFNNDLAASDDTTAINMGALRENAGSIVNYWDGRIYYICAWDRALTASELTEVNTYGCNGNTGGDSTPPTITNIKQYPVNTTVLNLASQDLLINATITDNVAVYDANLTLKLNHTEVYINGTLGNVNGTYQANSNSSGLYKWIFDETDLLGASYPLDPDYMFNAVHYNFSFQGTNKLLKYKFLNISNKIQSNFYEDMADNLTGVEGLSDYFYCNSSYTTGNPTVNNNCELFASVSNKANYHSHNKSFHRVISLGINTTTGKIGDVKVTPVSYILKRGTSAGEHVYYVNKISRVDFAQTSSNLGNSYSNLAYTPDVHIHQISTNPEASINYRICASDTSNNKVCSAWQSNLIEFLDLPPNAVTFTSPIENGIYNDSIQILHSESLSPSGYNITSYEYFYLNLDSGTDYTYITVLNQATHNTYTWDISGLTNGNYSLKLQINDSIGQSTVQYLQPFIINNTITTGLDVIILTSIDTTLTNIYKVINLIPTILLWIITTVGGLWLMFHGRKVAGIIVFIFSFTFDFILNAYYMDTYRPLVSTSSFSGILYGMLMYFMVLWIMTKVVVGISATMKL